MPPGIDANRPLESAQSRVDLSRFGSNPGRQITDWNCDVGVMVLEHRHLHVFPRSNLNGHQSVHCPQAQGAGTLPSQGPSALELGP